MAKQVIRRQGSSQEHASFTGAEGEWTHDNTLNTGRFHDGVLSGGYPALLSNKINEISASTNLDGSNFGELIVADSTSSSFIVTLPDPSVVGSGWQVSIKKAVDANSVTISPFDSESIDGDSSVVLENAENAIQVRTDGTDWYALRLNNFDDAQEILYDNSTSGLSASTVQGAIDEVVSDSDAFATLDGGNTFNGNQTLNDNLTVNGDVAFQSYSFPSSDGSSGQALLTDGSGNLSFGDVGGDIISEGNSSVEVVDAGNGSIQFTVDGSEAARFDSNGRLGIGTATPGRLLTAALSAENGTYFQGGGTGSNSESRRLEVNVSTTTNPGDTHILNATSSTGNLVFKTNTTERGRFDGIGNFKFDSGYGSVATAYGCRAWVNFDGTGTVSIRDSGNVSSITDNGTGDYTVNFETAMPDANYSVNCTTGNQSTSFSGLRSANVLGNDTPPSASSVRVANAYTDGIKVNEPDDSAFMFVSICR